MGTNPRLEQAIEDFHGLLLDKAEKNKDKGESYLWESFNWMHGKLMEEISEYFKAWDAYHQGSIGVVPLTEELEDVGLVVVMLRDMIFNGRPK